MSTQSGAGALLLADLEATLAQHGCLVVRRMDDILVLTPTRWTLRAAVRLVHQGLAALGLRTHPAKTCLGQMARVGDLAGLRDPAAGDNRRAADGRAVYRAGAPAV